jgi:hypothetical protein
MKDPIAEVVKPQATRQGSLDGTSQNRHLKSSKTLIPERCPVWDPIFLQLVDFLLCVRQLSVFVGFVNVRYPLETKAEYGKDCFASRSKHPFSCTGGLIDWNLA